MKKWMISACMLLSIGNVFADPVAFNDRLAQISNNKVRVWERTLLPDQSLESHRHEHDRVIVALTDGTVKIENNRGESHLVTLKKDTALYLTKDPEGETHSNKNMSDHPIKLMVIELL